jgi:hypothetical protein
VSGGRFNRGYGRILAVATHQATSHSIISPRHTSLPGVSVSGFQLAERDGARRCTRDHSNRGPFHAHHQNGCGAGFQKAFKSLESCTDSEPHGERTGQANRSDSRRKDVNTWRRNLRARCSMSLWTCRGCTVRTATLPVMWPCWETRWRKIQHLGFQSPRCERVQEAYPDLPPDAGRGGARKPTVSIES